MAEVVDPDLFPNPAVVTDGQFPRVLDGHAWLDDHATPNFGAKQSQPTSLEQTRPGEPYLEKNRIWD